MSTIEDDEAIADIRRWHKQLLQDMVEQGKREGKIEGRFVGRIEGSQIGRLATHALFFAKRLGRPLSAAERAVLANRLDWPGERRVVDICLSRDRGALAAWLADPST